MKYEVNIVYTGSTTYLVDAPNPLKAERIAKNRYFAGDNGDPTGGESESIERVEVTLMEEF
jgi:hypothetical protein